jgi:hypothetical protein
MDIKEHAKLLSIEGIRLREESQRCFKAAEVLLAGGTFDSLVAPPLPKQGGTPRLPRDKNNLTKFGKERLDLETKVMALTNEGKTAKEIADEIGIHHTRVMYIRRKHVVDHNAHPPLVKFDSV